MHRDLPGCRSGSIPKVQGALAALETVQDEGEGSARVNLPPLWVDSG